MTFSLIIPIYKVEAFIERCLKSVLFQQDIHPNDYEIIIVNDGSPDKSGEIAEKYISNIPNAKVYHKANGGLSDARNYGLSFAKGDYVWFVDSDDWIAPNSLLILKKTLEQNNYPEIIMFRAKEEDDNGIQKDYVNKYPFANSCIKSGADILLTHSWKTCSPFYLMRRDLLLGHGLKYMYGVYHEDNEFTPRVLIKSKSVVQIDDFLYFRYVNSNSITQVPKYKRAKDIVKVCDRLDDFYKSEKLSYEVKRRWSEFIAMTLNTSFYLVKKNFPDKKKEYNKELTHYKHLFDHLYNSGIKKYQLEYLLFKIIPNYMSIYSLMSKFK